MRSCYLLFLIFLTACQSATCHRHDAAGQSAGASTLRGYYRLLSLQGQNDTVFKPMADVDIMKIFTESNWVSVAYLKTNQKAVNVQGGTYTYSGGKMHETIQYHSKDMQSIGISTDYNVSVTNGILYQSGIFRAGTPDAWKIEEYWTKISD